MKKTKYLLCLAIALFVMPNLVFAQVGDIDEDGFEVIGETTKYYKTVTVYNNGGMSTQSFGNDLEAISSVTYEIPKSVYDAVNPNSINNYSINDSSTIETTYKEMTTSLLANGNTYRYRNILHWKIMPATRQYDIIGIGFYASVKPKNDTLYFTQEYTKNGTDYSSTIGTRQIFSNGASVTFKLPISTSVTSLQQTLYFDIEKTNPSSTIISQGAFGDYAHAISNSVGLLNAVNHEVIGSAGIVHASNMVSKYDTMSVAEVEWTGTW